MDFTSTLQHETGRKFENGTVLDSTGNYIALIAYFCMYLTVLQVLLCKFKSTTSNQSVI